MKVGVVLLLIKLALLNLSWGWAALELEAQSDKSFTYTYASATHIPELNLKLSQSQRQSQSQSLQVPIYPGQVEAESEAGPQTQSQLQNQQYQQPSSYPYLNLKSLKNKLSVFKYYKLDGANNNKLVPVYRYLKKSQTWSASGSSQSLLSRKAKSDLQAPLVTGTDKNKHNKNNKKTLTDLMLTLVSISVPFAWWHVYKNYNRNLPSDSDVEQQNDKQRKTKSQSQGRKPLDFYIKLRNKFKSDKTKNTTINKSTILTTRNNKDKEDNSTDIKKSTKSEDVQLCEAYPIITVLVIMLIIFLPELTVGFGGLNMLMGKGQRQSPWSSIRIGYDGKDLVDLEQQQQLQKQDLTFQKNREEQILYQSEAKPTVGDWSVEVDLVLDLENVKPKVNNDSDKDKFKDHYVVDYENGVRYAYDYENQNANGVVLQGESGIKPIKPNPKRMPKMETFQEPESERQWKIFSTMYSNEIENGNDSDLDELDVSQQNPNSQRYQKNKLHKLQGQNKLLLNTRSNSKFEDSFYNSQLITNAEMYLNFHLFFSLTNYYDFFSNRVIQVDRVINFKGEAIPLPNVNNDFTTPKMRKEFWQIEQHIAKKRTELLYYQKGLEYLFNLNAERQSQDTSNLPYETYKQIRELVRSQVSPNLALVQTTVENINTKNTLYTQYYAGGSWFTTTEKGNNAILLNDVIEVYHMSDITGKILSRLDESKRNPFDLNLKTNIQRTAFQQLELDTKTELLSLLKKKLDILSQAVAAEDYQRYSEYQFSQQYESKRNKQVQADLRQLRKFESFIGKCEQQLYVDALDYGLSLDDLYFGRAQPKSIPGTEAMTAGGKGITVTQSKKYQNFYLKQQQLQMQQQQLQQQNGEQGWPSRFDLEQQYWQKQLESQTQQSINKGTKQAKGSPSSTNSINKTESTTSNTKMADYIKTSKSKQNQKQNYEEMLFPVCRDYCRVEKVTNTKPSIKGTFKTRFTIPDSNSKLIKNKQCDEPVTIYAKQHSYKEFSCVPGLDCSDCGPYYVTPKEYNELYGEFFNFRLNITEMFLEKGYGGLEREFAETQFWEGEGGDERVGIAESFVEWSRGLGKGQDSQSQDGSGNEYQQYV